MPLLAAAPAPVECNNSLSFQALRLESELGRLDKSFGTIIGIKFTAGRFDGDPALAKAARDDYESTLEQLVDEQLEPIRQLPRDYRSRVARTASKRSDPSSAQCMTSAEISAEVEEQIRTYESSWRLILADVERFAAERSPAAATETLALR